MRTALCLTLVLAASASFAAPGMIPVTRLDGRLYVRSDRLQRDTGLAVKTLPGQHEVVVCSADRCALVKDFVTEGGRLWLGVDAVAAALEAQVTFGSARRRVRFELSGHAVPVDALGAVGHLAPDFRLTKLDGTPVALSDFRGQRVLINSWASW